MLAGCGEAVPRLDEQALIELHRPLYANEAFSDDPDRLWEHLAGSLHGRALTEHYVAAISAARQRRRDGVTVEVLRVDHDVVEDLGTHDGATQLRAAWSVGARVTHRGHAHLVVRRYGAIFQVAQVDAGPRIVRVAVNEARRVGQHSEGSAFDLLDDQRGGYLDALDLLGDGLEAP